MPPTHPAPPPAPNPALDCYLKSGRTPRAHRRDARYEPVRDWWAAPLAPPWCGIPRWGVALVLGEAAAVLGVAVTCWGVR